MLRGRVTGSIWATRRVEQIPNGAFLEVEVEGGSRLVAFDVLGSGVGERVLIAHRLGRVGVVRRHPPTDRRADHRLDRRPARRTRDGIEGGTRCPTHSE